MPTTDITLSELFPSMVYASGEGDTGYESRTAPGPDQSASTKQPIASMPLSPRQPWAEDIISLDFRTVRHLPYQPDGPEDGPTTQRLLCVYEATIRVRKPSKLASLKGRVDRNVIYDSHKGEFRLLICHTVGEPTLGILKSRVTAIDRFVSFLEALEKCKDTITSEQVSLGGVSFYYGEKQPQPSNGNESETPQRWRVELDLSTDQVDVRLDEGNPHLRVVDLMKRLVNLDGGISALMSWLPQSLPTFTAINSMETKWEDIQAKAQGRIEFSIKTTDWIGIRYTVMGTDNAGQLVQRQLALEAMIKMRRDETWWLLWRSDWGIPDDRFGAALQPIWDSRGDGWQGLGKSAAGKLMCGAAKMFQEVDDAIRGLVGNLDGDENFTTSPDQASQAAQQQQQTQKSGKGPEQAIEIS